MKSYFQMEGIDGAKKILGELAPAQAKKIMRNTIYGVAATIAKLAKQNAPLGETGVLRKSIKVKNLKSLPENPVSAVIFTTGKNKKYDAYYWRFVEHGTSSGMPASNFLRRAYESIRPQIPGIMREQFGKKLEKALRKK